MVVREDRKVSVDRIVAAPAEAVFALLVRPEAHAAIDGSGALLPTDSEARTPTLGAGSVFVTRMNRRLHRLSRADLVQVAVAIYVRGRMRNTVVEFDENRRIAWQNFGRHVWRFELEAVDHPEGPRTRIRETFDYATNLWPPLLEWAGFPERNREVMVRTLSALDNLVTTGTTRE